jgi:hypothetical protein
VVTGGGPGEPAPLSLTDSPAPEPHSCEQAVFDHWRSVHCHPNAKLDQKRRARILARIREGFTVKQLFAALDGAKFDRFLMGEDKNSGRVYDGIETLLRDRAQVERLIELKRNPKPARSYAQEDAFARQMREIRELEMSEAESKELQEILG